LPVLKQQLIAAKQLGYARASKCKPITCF